MARVRARAVAAVALIGATLLAGCGGSEGEGEDPGALLERTFGEPGTIESGVLDASVELRLSGGESEQNDTVSISGPFAGVGEGRAPRFDLLVEDPPADGGDRDFDLIATDDAGYISFEGESYEVAPAVFRRFKQGAPFSGLDPRRWLIDPSNRGTEEVGGAEAIRISGTADVERLIPDLANAAQRTGLPSAGFEAPQEAFEEATIDILTGVDDHLLRGLELRLEWTGELEGGEPFDAGLDLAITLSEVNEDQRIDPPEDVRPISELAERLPPGLSGLGEFLSGGSRGPAAADRAAPGPAKLPERGADP